MAVSEADLLSLLAACGVVPAPWQVRVALAALNDERHDLVSATEKSIAAADHLTVRDAGAVQALRGLAARIEVVDEYMAELYRDDPRGAPPKVDNVSVPTYLKYCGALGLTPAARLATRGVEPVVAPTSGLAGVQEMVQGLSLVRGGA